MFISIFTLVSVSIFQANAILQKRIFKSLARNQWFKGTFLWIKAGVKPKKKESCKPSCCATFYSGAKRKKKRPEKCEMHPPNALFGLSDQGLLLYAECFSVSMERQGCRVTAGDLANTLDH